MHPAEFLDRLARAARWGHSPRNLVRAWGLRGGRVEWYFESANLVVDLAKPYLADLARSAAGSTPLAAVAIGSGATAPAAGDTQLQAEFARAVVPAAGTDTEHEKNLRVGNLVTILQTFGPGVTGTAREAGLFGDIASPPGAAGAGRLYAHWNLGPYTLDGANQLLVEDNLRFD